MRDNKPFQQVQQATADMVASLRETSQVFADSVVTRQNCHLRFAQNTLLSWMELLTHQTASIQHGQQQWGPQIQKQQGAFQNVRSPPPMQISMNFFLAPFTLSRKLVEGLHLARCHCNP